MTAAADPAGPRAAHPPARRRSRRWFLAGGAAVVVGGGAGVGAGFLRRGSHPAPKPPPAALLEAMAAERELLGLAAAAVAHDATLQPVVGVLAADHRAHLRALQSALAGYDRPQARPGPSPTAPAPGRAQLRAREQAAGVSAAARALRLTGAQATLLASIAACESTHAEVLA